MTKNQILNGLAATAYIFLITSILFLGNQPIERKHPFLALILFIFVFTLSAAVMGHIFGYTPFQLYFDGKKKEAVKLFMQTTMVFGIIAGLLAGLLFSDIIS